MAKVIRSAETATKNWTDRAANASGFYNSQVQSAVWKVYAGSEQAEKNYSTGVSKAVAEKMRQKAVNLTDDGVWKAGVSGVGQARYSTGVAASAPRMNSAMSKLIPAIDAERKALGPRGIRGSAENMKRATDFMSNLSKKRGTFAARGVARTA